MKKIIFTLILLFTIGILSNVAFADTTTEVRQERMAALIFIGFMGAFVFVYYLVWKHKQAKLMERRKMMLTQNGDKLIIEKKPVDKKAA